MYRVFSNERTGRVTRYLLYIIVMTLIIKGFLYSMNRAFGYIFLIHNFNQSLLNLLSNTILLITIITIIMINIKYLLLKSLSVVIGIIILLYIVFIFFFTYSEPRYFLFSSTNADIVLEENVWGLGGWSNVYQRKNFAFVKNTNAWISTDDGYRPFSNQDYSLRWIDSKTLEINYGFGSKDIVKKEHIIIE